LNVLAIISLVTEIADIIKEMEQDGTLQQLENAGEAAIEFFHNSPKAQELVGKVQTLVASIPAKPAASKPGA
jgi:hypothetical protein